jgi:hypothetical protein
LREELWFRIAKDEDYETANVVPPLEDRPVVPRRQQVQPKDDDKKD